MSNGRDAGSSLPGRHAGGERVEVMLPLPLAGTYAYRVPAGIVVEDGSFVRVPFARRELTGVVWGPGQDAVPEDRLKSIGHCYDSPPLPAVSRRFVEWVAAYTVHPAGTVLRMAMSGAGALRAPRTAPAFRLAEPAREDIRWTDARRRVVAVLADGRPRTASDLARQAGVGPSVVGALTKAGVLMRIDAGQDDTVPPDWRRPGPALSPAQAAAAERLRGAVGRGFAVTVVDGVAGSGKTEVYFEAISNALEQGLQTLVLLPEIALGAQWLTRFGERFGAAPAQWHSDLGDAYRRRTWRAVAEGRVPVVVGARSALFLPFPRLGLIIVDEEHDASFKQDDGVAYNARDMAVVRARLGDLPAVLVSATPSLETLVNADEGRYRCVHLPDRHAATAPPAVDVVDLRADPPPRGGFLSPTLRTALGDALAGGSQAMLFLNRRGYAPLTLCRRCGFRIRCPNCTAWLVEHRLVGRLVCHHCGHAEALPGACPACGAEDSLAGCGPGVERVAEEIASVCPEARVALATSDTLTGPRAAADLVQRMESHAVDLVIGTQIVAKGYHFPLLTLVGVVDADLGLGGGDLRAAERTYQLLSQVAGRAGRAERPGRVVLQTHMPEHPVIAALARGDRDAFLAAEIDDRRQARLPPFGRLAAIIVSDPDERVADAAARALARAAPRIDGMAVLGPAPAPLALLRGRHRRRLLVKADKGFALSATLRRWLASASLSRSTRVQVDVDPYSFL